MPSKVTRLDQKVHQGIRLAVGGEPEELEAFAKKLMSLDEVVYAEVNPKQTLDIRIVLDKDLYDFEEFNRVMRRSLGNLFFMQMEETTAFFPTLKENWSWEKL